MIYNFVGNGHFNNVSETQLLEAGSPGCRVWVAPGLRQHGTCSPWQAVNGRTCKVNLNNCFSKHFRRSFYHRLKSLSCEPVTLLTPDNQWRETDIPEDDLSCSETGIWLGWAEFLSGRGCARRWITFLLFCVSSLTVKVREVNVSYIEYTKLRSLRNDFSVLFLMRIFQQCTFCGEASALWGGSCSSILKVLSSDTFSKKKIEREEAIVTSCCTK